MTGRWERVAAEEGSSGHKEQGSTLLNAQLVTMHAVKGLGSFYS